VLKGAKKAGLSKTSYLGFKVPNLRQSLISTDFHFIGQDAAKK